MKYIDWHCDTLMQAYQSGKEDIYELPGMLDLKRLNTAGAVAQVFAIFMPPLDAATKKPQYPGFPPEYDDALYLDFCFTLYDTMLKTHADILGAELATEKAGKLTALLSLEDGRPLDGKLNNLERYYKKGIRLITLTWNGENCLGAPNSFNTEEMKRGLTPFGKETAARMNELGMIVDASHLSDGGFWDLCSLYDAAGNSKKPFIASHSNCRALAPHPRNLSDAMINALASRGGLVGLNFCPAYLNGDIRATTSTLSRILAHAKHLRRKGGIDCIALGSDFDGIEGDLEIGGVESLHLLFEQFATDGFSVDEIEKIAYKNSLRFLKDVL
ncbi:peptidase [Spirochaetia bacterium]|nr:peptidase [Spirochaetia bacterium]